VYNPLNSGFSNLQETRSHLIQKGMSAQLADALAKRYLNLLETQRIYSVMDFFNSSSSNSLALNNLLKADMSSVHFSYITWSEYLQGIADK
jgi:hypothetical protein